MFYIVYKNENPFPVIMSEKQYKEWEGCHEQLYLLMTATSFEAARMWAWENA